MWRAEDMLVYGERLERLMSSDAAKEDVDKTFQALLVSQQYPAYIVAHTGRDGTEAAIGSLWAKSAQLYLDAAAGATPGSFEHAKYITMLTGWHAGPLFVDFLASSQDFNWVHYFGKEGSRIKESLDAYERYHERLTVVLTYLLTFDGMCCLTSVPFPLFARWGDVESARSTSDRCMKLFEGILQGPTGKAPCAFPYGTTMWPQMLYLLGKDADAVEFMKRMKVDGPNADATFDLLAKQSTFINARGEKTKLVSARDLAWQSKVMWLLVSGDDPSVLDKLPSADDLAQVGLDESCYPGHCHARMNSTFELLWVALACEKYDRLDQALSFAAMSVESDMAKGGQPLQWVLSLALCCRGRVLAKHKRKVAEATKAFDSALAVARSCGYSGFEMMAAQDKKRCVPAVALYMYALCYIAKEEVSAANVGQKFVIDRVLPALFLWPVRLLFWHLPAAGVCQRAQTSGQPRARHLNWQ
eukprot:SAG31_NODE_4700_length_3024_cov_2.572308_2_plen_472_part_00